MMGSIHQDGIAILKIYAPNNRTSIHMKQKLIELKRYIDKSKIIVGNLSMSISVIDRIKNE